MIKRSREGLGSKVIHHDPNKESAISIKNTLDNSIADGGNSSKNEVINGVSGILEDVKNGTWKKSISDSSFNMENAGSVSAFNTDYEIEMQPETKTVRLWYGLCVKHITIDKQVKNKYGVIDEVVVDFEISQIKDGKQIGYYVVKQKYNMSNSRESNLYQLYAELIDNAPTGRMHLEKLIGARGYCEVKYIYGGIFPKIVNIRAQTYNDANEGSAV